MTCLALISGFLQRPPETRTSKAGKSFVLATIRVMEGDGSQYWRLFVFSESAQAEILRMREGDALSAQGALKASLYRPEGAEPRLSLSLTADQVLPLRRPPKAKKPKSAAPPELPPPPKAARQPGDLNRYLSVEDPELSDQLPF